MSTDYFETRERALLGARYDALYASPRQTAERGVTVSALRTTPETFAEQAGFAMEPSPFCKAGFRVTQPDFKPGHHPYHHAGVFYAQEPSASSAAPLLDVQPGMRVLDMCAAPGGKSSQLAAALQGQGLLVSNEYVAKRADILKSNLERMGVANAVVLNEIPERIASAFPQFFDRILVDTPCSGEGMFRKEAVAVTQHSAELVQQCANLGAEILEAAATALAEGGVLVYSTCTFAPEEDEMQVGHFLATHTEFTLLDTMQGVDTPFGSIGEENRMGDYQYPVEYTRRIWRCQGGEGHFIAKFKKAGTPRVLPSAGELPTEERAWLAQCVGGASGAKSNARANKAKKGGRGRDGNVSQLSNAQGVSLTQWQDFAKNYFPTLCEKTTLCLGDNILLPAPFPSAAKLRILRAGVFVGNVKKGRFIPEHHLFTAFGAQCNNIEHLTLNDPRTAVYLTGGEIEAKTAQNGWCAVLVDGYPLGGGKVSGGVVKNHYPKALRNLR